MQQRPNRSSSKCTAVPSWRRPRQRRNRKNWWRDWRKSSCGEWRCCQNNTTQASPRWLNDKTSASIVFSVFVHWLTLDLKTSLFFSFAVGGVGGRATVSVHSMKLQRCYGSLGNSSQSQMSFLAWLWAAKRQVFYHFVGIFAMWTVPPPNTMEVGFFLCLSHFQSGGGRPQSAPKSPRDVKDPCWTFLPARCPAEPGRELDAVTPGALLSRQHCCSVNRWRSPGWRPIRCRYSANNGEWPVSSWATVTHLTVTLVQSHCQHHLLVTASQ